MRLPELCFERDSGSGVVGARGRGADPCDLGSLREREAVPVHEAYEFALACRELRDGGAHSVYLLVHRRGGGFVRKTSHSRSIKASARAWDLR